MIAQIRKVKKMKKKESLSNLRKTKLCVVALIIVSILMLSFVAPTNAIVKDLTPDYRKAGSVIDVLSWDIYGPSGGTELTQITFWYSGTDPADMEYVQFLANNTLLKTVYQQGAFLIIPGYPILEGEMVNITMRIKIHDDGQHGNFVDGYIENYVLTYPGAFGTDYLPANPAGYTIIDNYKPAVLSAWAVPDPAKDGLVTVTVLFNDTMLSGSPTVEVTGLASSPYTVSQTSLTTTTEPFDTWTGTFTLLDDDEEATATISVEDGEDLAGNVMVANPSAGTFEVDTINPTVDDIQVSDDLITEADVGDPFYVYVDFSETMDTAYPPTIDFTADVETSGTLTFVSGAWSIGDTRYTATYSVADVDEEVVDVDVDASGARDLAGNLDPELVGGDLFDVDTIAPTATDISVSDLDITEADVGDPFYVYVDFSETMDTAYPPTIDFSADVEASGTLTFVSGAWSSLDTSYTATYSVADVDEEVDDVDVTVGGARDLAGNLDPTTEMDMFDVDTIKPTVVSATASPDPTNEGTVTVTVVFSETMDTGVTPTVEVMGLDDSPYTVSESSYSGTTWIGTFLLDDDEEEETATISVEDGEDARGNVMIAEPSAGSFWVDTLDPSVTYIDVSDYLITEADDGDSFYVYVDFSETMDTAVAPDIDFTADVESSGTLTFSSGAWSLSDTRYTATYTIADVDETAYDVDVAVSGAQDLVGNVDPTTYYDLFDVDTEKPLVDDFWVSDENVTEADVPGNFYVYVYFSETMDTAFPPTIDFDADVEASGTLTFSSGAWDLGDTRYTATYSIADVDEEVFDVGVDISGGKDINGNDDDAEMPQVFDVDTVKPTVVSATAVPDPVGGGTGTVTVTVEFSEIMDTTVSPTVEVTGLASSPYAVSGSFFDGDTWIGTFTLFDDEEEATATISVEDGEDARGNVMIAEPSAGSFWVDTLDPSVTYIDVSDYLITEADDGDSFYVYVDFSETMDTAVAPDIDFTADVEASGTLTFSSGAWSLSDTRYTATYTIDDVDEEVDDVDVAVSGAQDLIGNVDPTIYYNLFDVDTIRPTVDDIEVSDDFIKEDDIPGTFDVTVTFSEPMNPSVIPTIDFDPDVSSTLVYDSGAWSAGDTVYTFTYDIADADVVVNDVGVTVGGAEDAAGNPDPLTELELFDIDTLHHAGVPEYIDVWAEYSAPMSIKLNANHVDYPGEGNFSQWNSPENALASDDQNAFITWADEHPHEIGMVLFFEEPPEALDVYKITSVKLHVEQHVISDLFALTEDYWLFEIGAESETPHEYDVDVERVGTETENELSIDITEAIDDSYELDWEYIAEMALAVYPQYCATPMGEWYVDNVWIEVNYVYEESGDTITIPVGGEANVCANVTDWFNDTVPDGTTIHFKTDLGTVYPLTDTTTSGIAMSTIISTDVGTATVNASGSLNGICEVTFVAHTLDVKLSPGWNLISVPRKLENTSIEAVFEGITSITKIYTYQNGNWAGSAYDGAWNELISGHPIEDIEDGIGYWVYATEPTTVTISLEPLGYVEVIPPDYDLSMGWTMIGYTTLQLEPVMPVPVYLTNLDGVWQSLYRYTPATGYDQAKPLDYGFDNTELGRGYWIYLNDVGVLVP